MSGFVQKIKDAFGRRGSEPPTTSFVPRVSVPRGEQAAKQEAVPKKESKAPELYPGNFYGFPFFISLRLRETDVIGYPKVPIRNMVTGETVWGSQMEWSYPSPDKMRAEWADGPERGLNQQTIQHPEDALGAEGRLGDMFIRFERILMLGKNQVVYSLYCPEKNIRLAYGFDRDVFEPGYVPPESSI